QGIKMVSEISHRRLFQVRVLFCTMALFLGFVLLANILWVVYSRDAVFWQLRAMDAACCVLWLLLIWGHLWIAWALRRNASLRVAKYWLLCCLPFTVGEVALPIAAIYRQVQLSPSTLL